MAASSERWQQAIIFQPCIPVNECCIALPTSGEFRQIQAASSPSDTHNVKQPGRQICLQARMHRSVQLKSEFTGDSSMHFALDSCCARVPTLASRLQCFCHTDLASFVKVFKKTLWVKRSYTWEAHFSNIQVCWRKTRREPAEDRSLGLQKLIEGFAPSHRAC